MSTSMLRVLVINNLPGDVRRMCDHFATLDELTCTALHPNELFDHDGSWDAIILTGTDVPPQRHRGLYDREIQMIREVRCPVLGICGGHQIVALSFGGSVGLLDQPLYGRVQVRVKRADPIVKELNNDFTVFTKHRFYVDEIPDAFDVIATDTSVDSAYIVKHKERPLYGVQFHPERRNQGTRILRNFFSLSRTLSNARSAGFRLCI